MSDVERALRADVEEYDQLLTRLRDLLTGTANALKGKPPPLVLHDWSDLPKLAGDVAAERDRLRAVVAEHEHALDHVVACPVACAECRKIARSALAHENSADFQLDTTGVIGGDADENVVIDRRDEAP